MIGPIEKHNKKRVKAEELSRIKSELKEGGIIIQCNHSESYKNIEHDEIPSKYFGNSLFYRYGGNFKVDVELIKHPITITSAVSDHFRIAAFTYFSQMIQEIQEKTIV